LKLFFLGFLGYTIAQGLQCVGLFYLPAVSVTFILNFTPIIVLVLGTMLLQEYPTFHQLMGIMIVVVGAILFFNDPLVNSSLVGILITLLSGLGWAAFLVSSRLLFIHDKVKPLELTAFPMGFGTLLMVLGAFSFEKFPVITPLGWGIIIWLGVVNTALAFFMWNDALQKLKAFEISILQNTMLVQIALLSYFFLGEQLTLMKIIAMSLVFIGVFVVQFKIKQ
jgi:drug/metabolite transporter (DMT)-like permease